MHLSQANQSINLSERLLKRFNRSFRPERPNGAVAEAYVEFIFSQARGSTEPEPSLGGQHPDLIWRVAPNKPHTWEFLIEVLYGYETQQSIRGLTEKVDKYDAESPQVYVAALVYEVGVDIEQIKGAAGFTIHLALSFSNDDTLPEWERTKTTESFTPGAFDSGYAQGLLLVPFPPSENDEDKQSQTLEVLTLNSLHKPHNVMDLFAHMLKTDIENKTLHL